MDSEKLIKNLADLRAAAAAALQDGACRVRLVTGESLVIYPAEATTEREEFYDVSDPVERDVVLSCLEPGGKVYSAAEAREELIRRSLALGIIQRDGAR